MNIEDLSKSQLLMLTILVNFIVSIATGVLTVSLLDQAPDTVTQTVNQIVDHTIETIGTSTPLATIIAPPTRSTPVATTEQLLTEAIADANYRSVNIYSADGTSTPLIAQGTYLPKAQAIITATQPVLPADVTIQFADGSTQMASISHSGATITIYGFGDLTGLPNAPSPLIVNHANLIQGETVVAITSDGSAVTGIVSKVDDDGVHTSLSDVPAGSAALDLNGNIIGISSGTDGLFFDADKITTLLTATSTAAGS